MPDDNRVARVVLKYETDQAALNQTKAASDALIKKLEAIGGKATETSSAFDRLKQVSSTIGRANDIESVGKQFAGLGKTIGDDTTALIQMRQVLKEIGASSGEIDQATRAFKTMQAAQAESGGAGNGRPVSIRAIAGVSGRLTSSALSGQNLDTGDMLAIAKSFPELTKELKALGNAAEGLPGILGSVASAGAAVGGTFGVLLTVVAPVALAVADVVIVMKLLQDSADKAAKAEKDRHDEEVRQIEELDKIRKKARTTSPEQSAQETGDVVADRAKQQKELDRLQARKAEIDAEYAALGQSINPQKRNDLRAAGEENKKAIEDQLAAMDKANQTYIKNTQVLDPLIAKHEAERQAVTGLLNATNAKSEADRLQAQTLDRITAATEGKTATTLKEEQAIEANIQAASKALDDTIAQKKAEIASNNDLIISLEKLGPDNEAAVSQIVALKAANNKLTAETDQLVKVTAPLVKQRQDEATANAQAAFANQKILDNILDNIKQGLEGGKKAANEFQKAIDEALKADERVAAVQQKFNAESVKIEERATEARATALQKKTDSLTDIERKSLEARADLQGKYNQTLVDLARKAADSAADTLRKLEQQRADLSLNFQRNEQQAGREAADKALDLRIKAAREDERASREHYQRLDDIRRAAQDREADLILNRDFLGLFQSRRQTTRDIEGENRGFVNKQGETSLARQQEADDAGRAIEIQRRERLIAYQNQVQDAQTNYQRELEQQRIAQARQIAEAQIAYEREIEQQRMAKARQIQELGIAYQREINALTVKTAQEQATLARAYDQELSLAATYGKARIDTERRTQEALLAQARSRLAALSGGSTRPVGRGVMEMASGGDLAAGQSALVNEPRSSGRESFTSGGKTIAFPSMGLFTPIAPGTVNANHSSAFQISMPISINESRNAAATAAALKPMIYEVLEGLTG